jgi:hypothetical protein
VKLRVVAIGWLLLSSLAFAQLSFETATRSATVVVARNTPGSNLEALLKNLLGAETRLEMESRSHYEQLLASALRTETPDHAGRPILRAFCEGWEPRRCPASFQPFEYPTLRKKREGWGTRVFVAAGAVLPQAVLRPLP